MDLLRTLLFVPASREDMVDKSPSLGADVVVLDLEDAVLPADKARARETARRAVPRLRDAGQPVCARLNGIRGGLTRDDVLAVAVDGLAAVVLPKVDGPQDLRDLDVLLREAEMANGIRPGTVAVIPLIESPHGLLRLAQTVQATDRLIAVSFGAEDYTAELGIRRSADPSPLAFARGLIVQVAVAYGLTPIDAPYGDFRDEPGLVAETEHVAAMGFKGKYVIHPSQVAPVNRVFTPSSDEVADARRLVEAFDAASDRGEGAVQLDGRMVDAPVAARARRLLSRADAVAARAHRTAK